MLLSLFKVKGHSMEPNFPNGSFFIASSIPFMFKKPQIGDIVVFKNENINIVKKIHKLEKGRYFLKGENVNDSKDFGFIKRNEILGRVIGNINL